MSEIRDHVAYLSQTIGPRPAGTEEEQQAALYITERLQAEADLPAVIEDFNCNPDFDIPRALCAGVAVVVAVVAMVVPMMAIPAFVVTFLAALLFVAESFDRPVISRFFDKGVSQNVVAKYEPSTGDSARSRRRKIILIAHYDSGKVRKGLSGSAISFLSMAKWAELAGMVLLPVLFLLRCLVSFGGIALIVVNVLTALALLCAALPILSLAVGRTSAYNEAANCNAAGVAVMMEVASRISCGKTDVADLSAMQPADSAAPAAASFEAGENEQSVDGASDASSEQAFAPVMHGERVVRESGLLPRDVQLSYEEPFAFEDADTSEDESPAARLLAAKAAIAAMTGKSVSPTVNIDLPDEPAASALASAGLAAAASEAAAVGGGLLAGFAAPHLEGGVRPAENSESCVESSSALLSETASSMAPDVVGSGGLGQGYDEQPSAAGAQVLEEQKPDVPEWFVKAQQKAKKPADDEAPVQRSRYADALDAAVRESSAHFQEANRVIEAETAMHLRQLRNSIREVKAPGFEKEGSASVVRSSANEDAGEALRDGGAVAVSNSSDLPFEASSPLCDGHAVSATSSGAVSQEPGLASAGQKAAKPVRSLAGVNLQALAAASQKEASSKDSQAASRPSATAEIEPISNAVAPVSLSASSGSVVSSDASAEADQSDREKPSPRRRRTIALPNIGARAQSAEPEQTKPSASAVPQAFGTRAAPTRRRLNSLPSVDAGESSPLAAPVAFESDNHDAPAAFFEDEAFANGSDSDESFARGGSSDSYYGDGHGDGSYGEYDEDAQYSSGGFAESGVGYVEVPKSRARSLINRFRFGRKREREEAQSSPQEWLDVDDDFNAREAGAARGGWESFQQMDSFDDEDLGSTTAFPPLSSDGFDNEAFESEAGRSLRRASGRGRSWNGGAFSRDQLGRVSTLSEDVAVDDREAWADEVDRELDQVYRFHNPEIDTEVWFVALGSELASNGGMKAFLREHAADLKGSVFVELDGLGSGDLCVVSKEGLYRPCVASSRLKRYAKKAAQAQGVHVSEEPLLWANTAAAYAMQKGCQAVHVAGFAEGKPAFYGEANDMLENVDEQILQRNVDYVMELVRQI